MHIRSLAGAGDVSFIGRERWVLQGDDDLVFEEELLRNP
jgi:hypothetical protein